MWLAYSLSYNLISLNTCTIALYTSTISPSSISTSPLIRSITLFPLSLFLSLKTSCISKLLIRGVVFSNSIWWFSFLIISPIRSFVFNQYNRLVTVILLLSKVMPSCSCCVEKVLVCVVIAALTGCQPSSCVKCTWVNIWLSCNVWSISNTECVCCITCLICLVSCLICYRVSRSVCYWEVGRPTLLGLWWLEPPVGWTGICSCWALIFPCWRVLYTQHLIVCSCLVNPSWENS